MKVICAYCKAAMADKEPLDDELTSHGMCLPCAEHFDRELNGLSLGEYLDAFAFPVIATDGNARVLAANQQMATLLHTEQRALAGLLGGDVLGCVHARSPGGCGSTVHCDSCAIRHAIEHTFETGSPVHRQQAYVQGQEGHLHVWISTVRVGAVVKVVIDAPGSEV